jgi:hypothetical protein
MNHYDVGLEIFSYYTEITLFIWFLIDYQKPILVDKANQNTTEKIFTW